MQEPALVIFDIAGTTVQDQGQVPAAFTAALNKFGVNVTAAQIKNVRGASKRQALMHFLPVGRHQETLADAVYESFRSHLMEQFATSGVLAIHGVVEAFGALRAHGVKVALNTGFDRETTRLLLDALGWTEGVVDAVVCGDEVTQGRPAPYLIYRAMEAAGVNAARDVANVGDTALDLQAGYNAGVHWNIGVLTGAHDRKSLESAPHTHILPSAAEAPGLWIKT